MSYEPHEFQPYPPGHAHGHSCVKCGRLRESPIHDPCGVEPDVVAVIHSPSGTPPTEEIELHINKLRSTVLALAHAVKNMEPWTQLMDTMVRDALKKPENIDG